MKFPNDTKSEVIKGFILCGAVDIASDLEEGEVRCSSFMKILNNDGGREALQERCGSVDYNDSRSKSIVQTTSDALNRIEASLKLDIFHALEMMNTKAMANID